MINKDIDKADLVNKITDRWTDNIYGDIVDILEAYTTKFEFEEEEEIVSSVIDKMIKMYS
jgi:hypothetical protein